jgi:hypothetical protein
VLYNLVQEVPEMELFFPMVLGVIYLAFWIAIVGAMIWGLLQLQRIRIAQEEAAASLKAIETHLRPGHTT